MIDRQTKEKGSLKTIKPEVLRRSMKENFIFYSKNVINIFPGSRPLSPKKKIWIFVRINSHTNLGSFTNKPYVFEP